MACVAKMDDADLRKKIIAIQLDQTLTDAQKAIKRQELMSGAWKTLNPPDEENACADGGPTSKAQAAEQDGKGSTMFDETLKCAMCMDLCVRPVTAPCQHNFCLGCFNKWTAQGKKTCPTCRQALPAKWSANPRINTALASAIRMAKLGNRPATAKAVERMGNAERPDEAFVTERAVRAGRANASSGRIMVMVPGDHFGPIPPEADPRGLGVRVGEFWRDRLDCRQWGAHFPHVAGIAGQSGQGAQSVVLSGGYEDDRDEGEWFLYTGSGGRDLSGNKRVSSVQSFDQTFDKMNAALLMSCRKGLPVRVVRSCKEKRSAYAPGEEQPVRYDGIYRIVRAYRRPGAQGKLVCRYLFVRADNEPAPWSSEDTGDQPWEGALPAEAVAEMRDAKGKVEEMGASPWWDWDAVAGKWGWARPAPASQRPSGDPSSSPKKLRRKASDHERALREFTCRLCMGVLAQPLSTPCGHHFCKPCLDKRFEGLGDVEAVSHSRALRVRKVLKPCPACRVDIAEFLATAQVNRGMLEVIAKLQDAARKAQADAAACEAGGAPAGAGAEAEETAEEACEHADTATDPDAADAEEADAAEGAEAVVEAAEEAKAGAAAGGPQPAAPSAPPSTEPVLEVAAAAVGLTGAAAAAAARREAELAALRGDFPAFDAALLAGMLDDQGGDVAELRAVLRRMTKHTEASERKAKRMAAAAVAQAATSNAATSTGQAQGSDDDFAMPSTAPGGACKALGKKRKGGAAACSDPTAAGTTQPGLALKRQACQG